MTPDDRYVEKLATPDVTVADLIGDVDPIKAARSGHELGSELTMHYGLLPRANRGIFAINEVPDLAGKIQVALFNIMQEGDVQIKGYPVRLELDVAIVFSANPEDYTARGKIVTPLKDRIGSEIRTHYPESLDEAISHHRAGSLDRPHLRRPSNNAIQSIDIPHYIRQIVEQIAFVAREDKKVDKRSGVSQRLPISTMELVVSNAERRALHPRRDRSSSRASATSSPRSPASPARSSSSTKARCAAPTPSSASSSASPSPTSTTATSPTPTPSRSSSGSTSAAPSSSTTSSPPQSVFTELKADPGPLRKALALKINSRTPVEVAVSAAEFLLEGMTAHKKISPLRRPHLHRRRKEAPQRRRRPVRRKMREREQERLADAATAPAAASTKPPATRQGAGDYAFRSDIRDAILHYVRWIIT